MNFIKPVIKDKEKTYYILSLIILLNIADQKANLMNFKDVKALQRIKQKLKAAVVDLCKQKTLDNWLAL